MSIKERLTELLKSYLPLEYTAVSYAISIGDKIYHDTIGHQGDPKVKADDNCTFNVASVSKIYCAIAVMQLVEKGLVELDRPVVEYLTDLEYADPRFSKVTLRHCLNHASGLPGTQWKGFSVSGLEGENYFEYVREYLKHNMLKAEPGRYSVYCNDGFTIAEMVVEAVTNMGYGQYCLENITAPIGAESSRLADVRNTNYPLITEAKRPNELLLIKGGAGYTTTMLDLCKFGKQFLGTSEIVSEESKAEMAKLQGTTFLTLDQRSALYGLGWDNVDYRSNDYDLGDGSLLKGGNSFQFTTQFIIVPKYNAVLAMSETHDCYLDVNAVLLRLFALAMAEEGVNICKDTVMPSVEDVKKYEGQYFIPSGVLKFDVSGATADINRVAYCGKPYSVVHNLKWNGTHFVDDKKQPYVLEEFGGETYLLNQMNGRMAPMAQKAHSMPNRSDKWESRVGKKYIALDFTANDIVIHDIMTGFSVVKPENLDGVYVLSFAGRSDSGVYGFFEGAVTPTGDDRGEGFLSTPSNPSRDLLNPVFFYEDGKEYCKVASYLYVDAETLSEYSGETFDTAKSRIYKITSKLEKLPEVPKGKRILITDEKMVTVYDSLFNDEYKAVEKGTIHFA